MLEKIDAIITMGGMGSRFRKIGYTIPKYMIEAKGRTLFEWSLMSLDGYRDHIYQYIFIVMKDENTDVTAFLKEKCKKLNIKNYHIIIINYLTDGQASTAMLAEKYWEKEHAALIYNIDTYVESGEINSAQLKGDGFIPCFSAEGEHWSFVRLDSDGKAVEIKEKKRISDHCSIGLYYFKSCRLFSELYKEYYQKLWKDKECEKYIAPLYDHLLSKGGQIYICDIQPEKVHVLGTPEELRIFLEGIMK